MTPLFWGKASGGGSIQCPLDVDKADQSYLLNGFTDYFLVNDYSGSCEEFLKPAYRAGKYTGMKLSNVPYPSATIVFGEKKQEVGGDRYMDSWPPDWVPSEHLVVVDHGKHRAGSSREGRGWNHVFADGSTRYLKDRAALSPVNLWAVTDEFRAALGARLERGELTGQEARAKWAEATTPGRGRAAGPEPPMTLPDQLRKDGGYDSTRLPLVRRIRVGRGRLPSRRGNRLRLRGQSDPRDSACLGLKPWRLRTGDLESADAERSTTFPNRRFEPARPLTDQPAQR